MENALDLSEFDDAVVVYETERGLFLLSKEQQTIDQFLAAKGLQDVDLAPAKVDSSKAELIAKTAGPGALAASVFSQFSGMFLQVTPQSAAAIQSVGLMSTGQAGTAYAMVGSSAINQWVVIQTGLAATLSNPATLAAVGVFASFMVVQRTIDKVNKHLNQLKEQHSEVIAQFDDRALEKLRSIEEKSMRAFEELENAGIADPDIVRRLPAMKAELDDVDHQAYKQLKDIADKIRTKGTEPKDLSEVLRGDGSRAFQMFYCLALSYKLRFELEQIRMLSGQSAHEEERGYFRDVPGEMLRKSEKMGDSIDCLLNGARVALEGASKKSLAKKSIADDVNEMIDALFAEAEGYNAVFSLDLDTSIDEEFRILCSREKAGIATKGVVTDVSGRARSVRRKAKSKLASTFKKRQKDNELPENSEDPEELTAGEADAAELESLACPETDSEASAEPQSS